MVMASNFTSLDLYMALKKMYQSLVAAKNNCESSNRKETYRKAGPACPDKENADP